jgi:AcrR family transcriptional regulator
MENCKLPRREREKLRQREEILAAALDLFSHQGYHNVCMHEIAEKSEFAIGTLYKFFANKEELYKALVLEYCDRFNDFLLKVLDEPDDEIEILRKYVRAKGELFCLNLPFVRLYVSESRGVSYAIRKGFDDEMRKRYLVLLDKLASVFGNGIRSRRLNDIAEPYYLAVSFDSSVNAFLLLWLEAPDRHPYPEDPDVILNIFIKGLVGP